MKLDFSDTAWAEFQEWATYDRKTYRRIGQLLEDIARTPYAGIGKPEPLKYALSGFWSRRITDEHRLALRVVDGVTHIVKCNGHYQ